jgi:hypothetical protein
MEGGEARPAGRARGAQQTSGPNPTAVALAILAVSVALLGLVLATFGLPAPGPGPNQAIDARPSPSSVVGSATGHEPGPSLGPSAPPLIGLPADAVDPPHLPRFPGSTLVGFSESTDGSVDWVLVEYLAAGAVQDEVREHYRQAFRDSGWFVGDVDYSDGTWTFTASRGPREARLEISMDVAAVRVVGFVSEEASADPVKVTPAPVVRSTPRPPRTTRDESPARMDQARPRPPATEPPRLAPERRADRDRDDDGSQPQARVRRPRHQTNDRPDRAPAPRADRDDDDDDDGGDDDDDDDGGGNGGDDDDDDDDDADDDD